MCRDMSAEELLVQLDVVHVYAFLHNGVKVLDMKPMAELTG